MAYCFCSNGDYGKHGEAEEEECNEACYGDATKMCGGQFRNSVYKTKNPGKAIVSCRDKLSLNNDMQWISQ